MELNVSRFKYVAIIEKTFSSMRTFRLEWQGENTSIATIILAISISTNEKRVILNILSSKPIVCPIYLYFANINHESAQQ